MSITEDVHNLPSGYRFAVRVARPPLMALTKRDWRGTHNLPRTGGCVIALNHLSYLDPFIVGHALYDLGRPGYFLGKVEVFNAPVIGKILHKADQIPVYRNTAAAADAYRAAVEAARAGKAVVIFPEATLTRDTDLWPRRGKTGAARVALETGVPLIPTAIWGHQRILGPYEKLPKILPKKTVRVLFGPPIDLSDLRDQPVTTETVRVATDRLMSEITGLLEVLREEPRPNR